jgi:solute:Na+ symporter, SSS family
MFCICSIGFVAVSLLTPAPDAKRIADLTWDNPLSVLFSSRPATLADPRVLSALLLLVMAGLYYVFR